MQVFGPSDYNLETLYSAGGPKWASRAWIPRASDPNRCRKAELVPGSPPQGARRSASSRGVVPKTPAAAAAPAAPADSLTRVHCGDSRLAVVQAYSAWIAAGRPKKKSPIPALMKTFDCERTYPKKLYDRVMKSGSVESSWNPAGRPREFSPACWAAMVTIIREHRAKHRVASSRDLSSNLKKVPGRAGKKAPAYKTVQRAKRELAFKKHKVQLKPKLNTKLWAARLEMAKARKMRSEAAYIKENELTVFSDEKWFSEGRRAGCSPL